MQSWLTAFLDLFKRLGWRTTLVLSLGIAAVSIVLAGFVVIKWPINQFKGPAPPRFWDTRHPAVRIAGLVAKNIGGYLIIILGIVMAVPGVPGQGLLLILTGLTLVDFPGKRRLERALIGRPAVLRVVNSLRKRFGRPALEFD
jgi:hypothetical protein